ncbi:BaiN/RdsA family NAD(P)/FAD-dependent oxidoreductase [Stakelama tenebrarum]|uniref:Aminoacetone oxidase family FAD-binding enzyme n=1 Tax=Stakelama tenebrarum TaxID=2711215 RepID=A0A6G6Y2Z6_9SPHN|nr:aminoacetone oxidase family FAD-binding enzyme [Sphingosinithalassobacter tenebrarum]QIG79088.1 aminoacetone oxidase family FAD-binding enzyme [Sphingosinithalassobacter tenebrarum]
MAPPQLFDVIVLGAGAAGMMCAAVAGQRGRRVLLLDHNDEPGRKILISGGGRCNFTNVHTAPDRFISANPHFAKSALSRYTPQDFIDLIAGYGIAWHEKTLGQLFCDESARAIVAMLVNECEMGSVTPGFGQPIRDVSHADGRFRVTTGAGVAEAPALVVATGGPSIPKLGATGFAYDLAKYFGLKLVEPRPALVPLTLGPDDALFRDLAGVSAPVRAKAGKGVFDEAALFTHRGLSGPAILQVSSYWRHGEQVAIDFFPQAQSGWLTEAKREHPRATMRSLLARQMPDRLAEALAEKLALAGELANQKDAALAEAERRLSDWRFRPTGTEAFAKAEVTVGGISTAELSSQTMEAKKLPGLYPIGEAVDVTGWLGGYNFQWAWASAQAAGRAL